VAKVAKLVWEDAQQRTTSAWNEQLVWEYVPYYVTTVGIVLYEGPEGYVLTDSLSEELVGNVFQIPKAMVKEETFYV
jgi:hypothetical protein